MRFMICRKEQRAESAGVRVAGFDEIVIVTFIVALFLTACTQQMADQPRYDVYQKSYFFSDMSSARPLPAGTIPHDYIERDELLDLGLTKGQPADRFPFAITMEVLRRGQDRFDIYCTPCHGYVGNGDGMAARRGFRTPPASFHSDRLRSAAPGQFFDVITNGFGSMPRYAFEIEPRDRWAIIAYIRALQLSQWATIEDVPADMRQTIGPEKR